MIDLGGISISAVFSSGILVVCMLLGLFLCFKLKFIHLLGVPRAIFSLINDRSKSSNKGLSSFAALSSVLGGNLGVGNISGVAVAIAAGGPGAVFWMCVSIALTSAIKYASCLLGVYHRKPDKGNPLSETYVGGPMYSLDRAADMTTGSWHSSFFRLMSYVYAFSVLMGAVAIGNCVQVHSIATSFVSLGVPKVVLGLLLGILTYKVINNGLQAFAKTSARLVPFMGLIYMLVCFFIIFKNLEKLPEVVSIIIDSAFSWQAVGGAGAWTAFNVGSLKAVLATDVGLGLEAIVHSHVKRGDCDRAYFEVEQGLISSLSPLFVAMFVIMTSFTLMITGAWLLPDAISSVMVIEAFNIGMNSTFLGSYFVPMIMFLFAFTTVLTWVFCSEKALFYITTDSKVLFAWKLLFVMLMPFGAVLDLEFVWGMADIIIPVMLLPNVVMLLFFMRDVVFLTRHSSEKLQ